MTTTPRRWLAISTTLLVAAGWAGFTRANEEATKGIRFDSDVRPILETKCLGCHNAEKHKGGLNLESVTGLQNGGDSGVATVAGKPDESLLFQRVLAGEMPPEEAGKLTASEIEKLRQWITAGAPVTNETSGQPRITQHDITPLMLLRCTACHGGRRREADLDLRTKAGMLRGGKSGPAVVPGDPAASLIVKRIRAEEMPPRRLLVSVSVKPMEAGELERLERWIAEGLPESPLTPDVATPEPDALVSGADRQFWSFQPPRTVRPAVDGLTGDDLARVHNPIDLFVLRKLREQGLSLSPEADRTTLVRRLYFDLLGLPPTPDEVAEFVHDDDPRAYEALVERLLSSPRYGERWGRHWLDVAGYADSEGAQNEDRIRPTMWRYRDYVVRALNADKPYDRFLHEQIAGDELADYEHAAVVTEEIYDNLVATGFLRTAPDRTFADITNFVPDRLEVIADEIQILGSSVLGLTLHCARCHSHKFDPLPQRDYYRLAAALKDALDEHDWIKPETRALQFVTTAERRAWEQHNAAVEQRVASLKEQLAATTEEGARQNLESEIKAAEGARQPEPLIRALWSRGAPSPTYILRRGNYLTPGREVGPGVPSVLTNGATPLRIEPPWPGANTTGRRLALARWLTEPHHPLTARVMVNRLWKHHFGRGLVSTLGNFGVTGAPPTHPELLDWLAGELVRRDWSIKEMHRLMVTSSTYRQSSVVTPSALTADPENQWLSRMPLRRMEAEVVRDALLQIAGELNHSPFGPPDDVDVREDGLVTARPHQAGWRRSIYVLQRRTKLPTILESFDSPQMGPNCLERSESIVAPQALHLLNNSQVHELAGRFAARVQREVGDDVGQQVAHIHQIAIGRPPTQDEQQVASEMWNELRANWRSALNGQADVEAEASRRALANYCHAVMNSAAFLFID